MPTMFVVMTQKDYERFKKDPDLKTIKGKTPKVKIVSKKRIQELFKKIIFVENS